MEEECVERPVENLEQDVEYMNCHRLYVLLPFFLFRGFTRPRPNTYQGAVWGPTSLSHCNSIGRL